MVVNAEKDGVARLAEEGDSRITKVGAFIRKVRTEPKERIRELVIEPPVDRVAAIAAARTSKVAVLRVPAGMELPEAVVLTGTGNGEQAAESFLFEIRAGARATIV